MLENKTPSFDAILSLEQQYTSLQLLEFIFLISVNINSVVEIFEFVRHTIKSIIE